MTQEKLSMLFEQARTEPVSVQPSDVMQWLESAPAISAPAKGFPTWQYPALKVLIAAMLTAGMIIWWHEKTSRQPSDPIWPGPLHPVLDNGPMVAADSGLQQAAPQAAYETKNTTDTLNLAKADSGLNRNTIQISFPADTTPAPVEIPKERELPNADDSVQTAVPEKPVRSDEHQHSPDNVSGFWSNDDKLEIDTLFRGVKKFIYLGEHNNKIEIRGSKRTDVSMSYRYESVKKGIILRKKEDYCKVQYALKDSVLTVQCKKKSPYVTIGTSRQKDNMVFEVPENISIDLASNYGSVVVSSMKGSVIALRTNYGEIKATGINGSLNLKSGYGDIELQDVSGPVDANTNYGNISGNGVLAADHFVSKTNFGNIELQLGNPIGDCTVEAATNLGKIHIDRKEVLTKGNQLIRIGSGPVKISLKTNHGNVLVR